MSAPGLTFVQIRTNVEPAEKTDRCESRTQFTQSVDYKRGQRDPDPDSDRQTGQIRANRSKLSGREAACRPLLARCRPPNQMADKCQVVVVNRKLAPSEQSCLRLHSCRSLSWSVYERHGRVARDNRQRNGTIIMARGGGPGTVRARERK